MPHIKFALADLRALIREPELSLEELDRRLLQVKGELKLRASSEEEVKVELQDTNRPDTWCVEGIARQLGKAPSRAAREPVFRGKLKPAGAIEVDDSVRGVRPFVAGFLARGYRVDDAGLRAFIAAQEVLSENFGRRRKGIAIGIYDASALAFPIRYEAVAKEDPARAFVPLQPHGEDELRDARGEPLPAARWRERWTPAEILRDHPTGRRYAEAIPGPSAPLLSDARGEVLSFPPVINSAGLGRVAPGMDQLFVEVTGGVLDQVLLAANILAANLLDRGAELVPVVTRYPWDTPRGREVLCPNPLTDRRSVTLELAALRRLLGEARLSAEEVRRQLEGFGLEVAVHGEELEVTTPPWRLDYLHPVDAIEDFAIARGYDEFIPLLPQEFTVGGLAPANLLADWARDAMIGCGFEEAIGNLLTSPEELRARMRLDVTPDVPGAEVLHGGPLVRIHNVMNQNYAVLRDWLLPTLMAVESHSSGALFPHRVFEAGEVCLWDPSQNQRSRTELRLAALLCHDKASFSELQAALDELLRRAGLRFSRGAGAATYQLSAAEHPSFIPGRAAWIEVDGRRFGLLGELHPEVLERWGVYFPAVAFELGLAGLEAAMAWAAGG